MKSILIKTALTLSATFLSFTLFAQEYTFKKVREFNVESLAEVGIRDYDPKRDIYASYIRKGSNVVDLAIFDSEGKIIASKVRRGEGPDDYLMSALTMGFSPEGNLWVQTSMELLQYDLDLNLIERIRFEPKLFMNVYTGPWSKFIPLNRSSEASFIVNGSNISNMSVEESIPSKIFMIGYYDAMKKSIQSVIPLSSRKVYVGIEDEDFPVRVNPVFTIDSQNSNLYFTTSFDNEITVYNPINWNVIQRIPVKHEFFKALDDIPLRESNFAFSGGYPRSSMNEKILKFDLDLVGLVYLKEISEATLELMKSQVMPFRMYNPEFQRIILFKSGVQLPGELTIPSGPIQMTLPNNRVLVKVVNEEEELDYYAFEIWELFEN